jgi:NAD(P)-dependent dehydrogenase (short-subunit alcohol dehydrogenase family)
MNAVVRELRVTLISRQLSLRSLPIPPMKTLEGKVAVVTGASVGVGRGIATTLARLGARVFVTGRSVRDGVSIDDDQQITGIRCDHRVDAEVSAAFERVEQETNGIDILVNNVWGGYEPMIEDGAFTRGKPFWEQPLWRWDAMFSAGVRAHYYASQLVARKMVANRRGLIVNISLLVGTEAHRECRGLAAIAGLTLAVGIGASTAIFGVVDHLVFRPYPCQQPAPLPFGVISGLDGNVLVAWNDETASRGPR